LKENKEILIIAESIDIDDSSGSKVNVALIKNLAAIGYHLKVLHYTRKEILINNVRTIAIKERKSNLNYFLSRSQRILQRNLKINLATFLEGIFGFSFTFFNDIRSIKKAVKDHYNNEQLVITLSKGASFRPHFALLKIPEIYNKWLAYIHDPYPHSKYPPPYTFNESGYKKKEMLFNKIAQKAKFSAFPSQLLKEWMESFYPNFLHTGIIIPHQFSTDFNINDKLPDYFKEDKFTLLHAGNLLKQRPPEALIKAYENFLIKFPEAKNNSNLLLLGPAIDHSTIIDEAVKKNPQICFINKSVPFLEVAFLQQKATVNVILEATASISPFLPAKFTHCVYANRPVLYIGSEKSEVKRLLGEDYLYSVKVNSKEEITAIITMLYLQWEEAPDELLLNRKDLEEYVGVPYLKKIMKKVIT